MSKILIVGGAGYIGSINVREFLNVGYDVVVVDNLNTGHLSSVDKRAKFYNLDIRNKTDQKCVSVNRFSLCRQMHFVQHKPSLYYFSKHVLSIVTI